MIYIDYHSKIQSLEGSVAKLLEDIESMKKERSKVAVNASACNTTRSNELASLEDD